MREIHDIHDVTKYQSLVDVNAECEVFLFTSPASMPIGFAQHPWFVVNKKGTLSRWEVLHWQHITDIELGHVHVDFLPPFLGMRVFIHHERFRWSAKLLGKAEGEIARTLTACIEESKLTYPHSHHYKLSGPNSNTYAQWVLNQVPEFEVKLPWNSFGKKHFVPDESF